MISLKSPNQDRRPAGIAPDLIVIHADAGRTDHGTITWLLDPASRVSYHYLITRAGDVYRFVGDDARAWHAGQSSFDGRPRCNDYSIGVAFANNQAAEPFPAAAVDAGVALVARLARGHTIPVTRVVTHAAVAVPAGRKTDPGPLFPWDEFTARVEAILR